MVHQKIAEVISFENRVNTNRFSSVSTFVARFRKMFLKWPRSETTYDGLLFTFKATPRSVHERNFLSEMAHKQGG